MILLRSFVTFLNCTFVPSSLTSIALASDSFTDQSTMTEIAAFKQALAPLTATRLSALRELLLSPSRCSLQVA